MVYFHFLPLCGTTFLLALVFLPNIHHTFRSVSIVQCAACKSLYVSLSSHQVARNYLVFQDFDYRKIFASLDILVSISRTSLPIFSFQSSFRLAVVLQTDLATIPPQREQKNK